MSKRESETKSVEEVIRDAYVGECGQCFNDERPTESAVAYAVLAALEAAGWVCAPREPTPEMLNAGFEAPGPLELKHNPGEYSGCEWAKMEAAATWAAMLEARPK